ncbi:MAG: Ig-like domain-containing protein [Chitinophagaceae bacterium]|nr:Ig-like domain-containing protein [Chitinophagaceae bacterium]
MLRFSLFMFCFHCLINVSTFAQPNFKPGNQKVDLTTLKKTHPRVLTTDFEPIKARIKTNPIMQHWLQQLSEETNMDALALQFRLTGNTSLIQQSFDSAMSLDMVVKVQKGPQHYSRFLSYLGCVYDWLYDFLTPEQRIQLLSVIKQGLNGYLKDPSKTNFHNLNHCLHAGAMVAAIAIADEEPAMAKKVLELAINNINLTWYKPDGVTPEGPHYMNWSSLIMISGLASLETAFSKTFGLSDEPGLEGYGDFQMHISVPKKGIGVKYSDCYTNGTYYNLGQFFWIANKFNRPDIAQFALENEQYAASGEQPDYSGKVHQLLWYNPEQFQPNTTIHQTIPLDKQFNSAALATMRNSWDDDNTIFAAIKGTDNYHQANFYHRHTNTGTFFLSALGQQWAVDLGLEDYSIPDYNVQPRLYYKLRAEGHNCNVINPASGIDQLGWEYCPISAKGNSLQESFAIIDMTPDYVKLAQSAKRGLKLFDNRRKVLLQDEIIALDDKPLDSYWFMQTEAGIEIAPDGKSAMLYRANEKMLVYMSKAPKDARFTVMATEPLVYTKPTTHKQDWTFGTKKLTIHTNSEKNLQLAVVFVPIQKGDTATIENIPYETLDNWKIDNRQEATLSNIKLNNTIIPNFDKRVFTYTIDNLSKKYPNITAKSDIKNAVFTIIEDKILPGKTTITVKAPNCKPSVYKIYVREKPVEIIGNRAHEYSSWDESFANHRIIAPKIKAGQFAEYILKDIDTIGAMTIGFTNQQTKVYPFEVWSSEDRINWKMEYKGATKRIPGMKLANPQLFGFQNFTAKYIRIKNPDSVATFSVEILKFHKDKVAAEEYINHAYKEVLTTVTIVQKALQIKIGEQVKMGIEGLSNYGKKMNLKNAILTFESENPAFATVTPTGEVTGVTKGLTYIRVIVQEGDYVFHKKVEVRVGE